MGMRSTGGNIVQVEGGGHIVRSTGRKDRHSKVYTAKGPRDRRVRLSAHTAIEFYDVQDRLGYDRPSKAVDWLIKKAKPSIDKLVGVIPTTIAPTTQAVGADEEQDQDRDDDPAAAGSSSDMAFSNNIADQPESSSAYGFYHHHSSLVSLPPPPQHMDTTDPIAFFPTTSSTNNHPSVNFQDYPSNSISRATGNRNPTQDLGLSLHSFQHHHHHHQSSLFSTGPTSFSTWNNEESMVMNRVMVSQQHQFLAHDGGGTTLHHSFPLLPPWSQIPVNPNNVVLSEQQQQQQQEQDDDNERVHLGSIFGSRFVSDGLGGFGIPARIRVDGDSHGGGVGGSSTTSSASHNSQN